MLRVLSALKTYHLTMKKELLQEIKKTFPDEFLSNGFDYLPKKEDLLKYQKLMKPVLILALLLLLYLHIIKQIKKIMQILLLIMM